MSLGRETVEEIYKTFSTHRRDTGNHAIQLAILTLKIDRLRNHLVKHPTDDSVRNALFQLRRQRQTAYLSLKVHHPSRVLEVVEALSSFRSVTLPVLRRQLAEDESGVKGDGTPLGTSTSATLGDREQLGDIRFGIVFMTGKGFGFLRDIETGAAYYFRIPTPLLTVNSTVSFAIGEYKGRLEAKSVSQVQLPIREALILEGRKHLGYLPKIHRTKVFATGFGFLRTEDSKDTTYFKTIYLPGGLERRTVRLRFYTWDSPKGPVAENITIDRPELHELLPLIEGSGLEEWMCEECITNALPSLFYFKRNYASRSWTLVRSRLLDAILSIKDTGLFERTRCCDLFRQPLQRLGALIGISKYLSLIEEGDSKRKLLDVFTHNLRLFLSRAFIRLLPALEVNHKALGEKVGHRVLVAAVRALRVVRRRKQSPLEVHMKIGLLANLVQDIAHAPSVVAVLPQFAEWLLTQDQPVTFEELTNLFGALGALRSADLSSYVVLMENAWQFSVVNELRQTGVEINSIAENVQARVTGVRLSDVSQILRSNFDHLADGQLRQGYLDTIRELRMHWGMAEVARFYLVPLVSMGSTADTLRYFHALVRAAPILKGVRFPARRIGVSPRGTSKENELRRVLDYLSRPIQAESTGVNCVPKDITDLLDIDPDTFVDCQQSAIAHGVVSHTVKYMSSSVTSAALALTAQKLSDLYIFESEGEGSRKPKRERLGEYFAYAQDDLRRTVIFHTLEASQLRAIMERTYNPIQCCLFNNRAYVRHGLEMACDPHARQFFISARGRKGNPHRIACGLVFECTDASGGTLWTLDGVVGNSTLLARCGTNWKELLMTSLNDFVAVKGGRLACASNLEVPREAIDREFLSYVKNFYATQDYTGYLRKKCEDGFPYPRWYTYTWSQHDRIMYTTEGFVNVLIVGKRRFESGGGTMENWIPQ